MNKFRSIQNANKFGSIQSINRTRKKLESVFNENMLALSMELMSKWFDDEFIDCPNELAIYAKQIEVPKSAAKQLALVERLEFERVLLVAELDAFKILLACMALENVEECSADRMSLEAECSSSFEKRSERMASYNSIYGKRAFEKKYSRGGYLDPIEWLKTMRVINTAVMLWTEKQMCDAMKSNVG